MSSLASTRKEVPVMFDKLKSMFSCRGCSRLSLGLVVGMVALGSGATALADHGFGRAVVVQRPVVIRDACRPVVVHQPVVVHRHGDTCGCDACGWKREYQRGFNRGEAAGANAGFRDGINGKNFCDAPIDELRDNSAAYRDGYLAAFKPTYGHAFQRGRHEAQRSCQVVIVKR
jgi:hypothetical protein